MVLWLDHNWVEMGKNTQDSEKYRQALELHDQVYDLILIFLNELCYQMLWYLWNSWFGILHVGACNETESPKLKKKLNVKRASCNQNEMDGDVGSQILQMPSLEIWYDGFKR